MLLLMASFNFVSEIPEEYICQVCMKVLQEPHATECCGQHYCRVCLEEWLQKSLGDRQCPHCRQLNFNHILYKPIQCKINELKVYCTNKNGGCTETPTLGSMSSHLTYDCKYAKVECPNKCGERILRKDREDHLANHCIRRCKRCLYCKTEIPNELIDDHLKVCDYVPVLCPKSCGEAFIRRGELKRHETYCPNAVAKCPFYEVGCEQKVLLRKDLEEHVDSNTNVHLLRLLDCFITLKGKYDNLKRNYDILRTDHEVRQEDYEDLKQELKTLKSQAAISIERMKENEYQALEKPLESLVSVLKNNVLCDGDSITFAIPMKLVGPSYTTPPFFVFPGYKFSISLTKNTAVSRWLTSTNVKLCKLENKGYDQLKWPPDMAHAIEVDLSYNTRDDSTNDEFLWTSNRVIWITSTADFTQPQRVNVNFPLVEYVSVHLNSCVLTSKASRT